MEKCFKMPFNCCILREEDNLWRDWLAKPLSPFLQHTRLSRWLWSRKQVISWMTWGQFKWCRVLATNKQQTDNGPTWHYGHFDCSRKNFKHKNNQQVSHRDWCMPNNFDYIYAQLSIQGRHGIKGINVEISEQMISLLNRIVKDASNCWSITKYTLQFIYFSF